MVGRFRNRPASWIAQSAPLIFSKGPRPVSTASLDPVQEQEDTDGQPRDVPGPHSDLPTTTISETVMPVTATVIVDEKAAPPAVALLPAIHTRDLESSDPSRMRSLRTFLMEEIDTAHAAAPLSAYCFMTGFMCALSNSLRFWFLRSPADHSDAVSFSAVFVWCAFQTGNSVQVRLFSGSPPQILLSASVACTSFGTALQRSA